MRSRTNYPHILRRSQNFKPAPRYDEYGERDILQPTEHKEQTLVIAPDQVLTVDSDRAVWREIGDEVVILDVPTTTYLNLNKSARVLWKRLDAGATPLELAAELVTIYGISDDQAAADVRSFLDALQKMSLLSFPT
jgi:hypothetical protein